MAVAQEMHGLRGVASSSGEANVLMSPSWPMFLRRRATTVELDRVRCERWRTPSRGRIHVGNQHSTDAAA